MQYYNLPIQVIDRAAKRDLKSAYPLWAEAYKRAYTTLIQSAGFLPSSGNELYKAIAQYSQELNPTMSLAKTAQAMMCQQAYVDWRSGVELIDAPPMLRVPHDLLWVRKREVGAKMRWLTVRLTDAKQVWLPIRGNDKPAHEVLDYPIKEALWQKEDHGKFTLTVIFRLPEHLDATEMQRLKLRPEWITEAVRVRRSDTLAL